MADGRDQKAIEVPNVPEGHVEVVSSSIYSVANIITVLRLLLVPFFFTVLLRDTPKSDTAAFLIFAIAASTDFLDGMIARRTGTVTAVGKIIDPLVDRLLIASGVVGLYIVDRLPLWVVLVLVFRDLYLLAGSAVLERRGLRMPVTWLGKITTATLLVGFASLVWGRPTVTLPLLGTGILGLLFVYVGLVLSVSAAVQYTFQAARLSREASAG